MKKIIKQFALTVTIVFSFCFIMTGSSLISKRSAEIGQGQRFTVFAVKNESKKLELEAGKEKVSIDFSALDNLKKYKDLVFFTPVGATVGFVRTVREVLFAS